MINVLESVESVIKESKHVHINKQAVLDFAKNIAEEDLEKLDIGGSTSLPDFSEEEQIGLKVVFNAVNFCYWGEPKWTVEVDGKKYDGAQGLMLSMKKAVENGSKLLNADYLAEMPEDDWEKIVKGNVEIPLYKERLQLLRSFGQTFSKKFHGSFLALLDDSEYDCVKLVDLLTREIPDVFNDVAEYHDKEVGFYKRAQLLADNIYVLGKQGVLSKKMKNQEGLTSFADYKVPQGLRNFGILEYSDDLAQKVDSLVEIPNGSDEEIEIRAGNVWAIELVNREVKKRFPDSNGATIDKILWHKGQERLPTDKPYHRTKTIWY